jgi:hypothetical protein
VLKRPILELDHSPPPCAEVRNEWSYASSPLIWFYGVGWYKFIFCTSKYDETTIIKEHSKFLITVKIFLHLELCFMKPKEYIKTKAMKMLSL